MKLADLLPLEPSAPFTLTEEEYVAHPKASRGDGVEATNADHNKE